MRLVLTVLLLLVGTGQAQNNGTFSVEADPHQELNEARLEERSILDKLRDIDRELLDVRKEMDDLQVRIRELDASRMRHADEVAGASAIADRQRDVVSQRLDALYRLHRKGLARVIFGADDPADLRRRSNYLEAIIEAEVERLEDFGRTLDKKRQSVDAVEQDMQAVGALRAELQLKEAELRDQRARRVELLDDVRSRREIALRAMSEMSGARRDLGERLGSRSTGGAYDLDGSSSSSTPSRSFRQSYGQLPWPVTGQVLHRYGSYKDDRTGQRKESLGIDIVADYGMPVRAVFDGSVTLSEYVPGYGQTVVVEHGPYLTIYAHLGGIRVRKGERVETGHVVGLVGDTGLTDSDGYMLTFEVRYNRTAQDPMDWLTPR